MSNFVIQQDTACRKKGDIKVPLFGQKNYNRISLVREKNKGTSFKDLKVF